jgi:hypothetical protein
MKAYYLLAPLCAIAFTGCTVVRPVAYQPVITPAPVAVAPAYVSPPTAVFGAAPAPNPGEGEGPGLSR